MKFRSFIVACSISFVLMGASVTESNAARAHHSYRAAKHHMHKRTHQPQQFVNPWMKYWQTQLSAQQTLQSSGPRTSWQKPQKKRSVRFAVASSRSSQGSRPAHCPHAWCGCFLAMELGINDPSLNVAANWARVGTNAGGPGIGVIVVWRHHVGRIVGGSPGAWVVRSGNDGNAVRERVFPLNALGGVIAYRRV